MGIVIISALYFFLPSYVANAMPIFLAKFHLFEFLNIRVDLGYSLKGEPLFGATKTYRGIIGGIIISLVVVVIQSFLIQFDAFRMISVVEYRLPEVLFLGFLMGFGEGTGDLIKSFFKRRLHIKSNAPAIPLDQSSFLLSLLLSFLYIVPDWQIIVAILLLSPLLPIAANMLAYKVGWKDVWW